MVKFIKYAIQVTIAGILLFMGGSCGRTVEKEGLMLVNKPDTFGLPRLRRHAYIPPPKGFMEIPFVETAPVPLPTQEEEKYGFILFSRPITQPVYENSRPRPFERIKALSFFTAPGEYEPVSLSIYPLRAMHDFRVMVSDLRGENGEISKDNLDIRLVTSHAMRYPYYTSVNTYRKLPELLERVTVNDFGKDTCQRYFITAHIPEEAAPGLYRGHIRLFDDHSDKAVQIPLVLRVLPFRLKKDPQKHFTSFMLPYSHLYRGFEPDTLLVKKAIAADFSHMPSFGFDYFPVFYLRSGPGEDGKGAFYIKPEDQMMIDEAIAQGLKGRLILVGGTNWFVERYHPECKPAGGHGKMNRYPPPGSPMFAAITQATRKFIRECRDKGMPPLLFFPADEPREHNAEYMSRVYEAFKKGGAMTLLTNDPTTSYAHYYFDRNCVDIWCSQSFGLSYQQVTGDTAHQYWVYPNHNAGEKKDRVIEQKGGRMTYGLGLWRSGYNALMPWAWRWVVRGNHHFNQFQYIKKDAYASGCGNRLDEKANFIPAINWVCFREGYDDGRYLYTLQQTILEREHNRNPRCQALVREGKKLLDSLWSVIEPKKKYLRVEFFDDRFFNNIRWQMASLTMKLLDFSVSDTGVVSPSVLAHADIKSKETNDNFFIEKGRKQGIIQYFDMAAGRFSGWKANADKELKMYRRSDEGDRENLIIDVTVDQKHDGANKTNKNPIGWPLVHYDLKGENLLDYDFLTCKVRFESNRDNVTSDASAYSITKVRFVFRKEKGEYTVEKDLGGNENLWQRVKIPFVKEMEGTRDIAIVIYEGSYPDHTHVVFEISEIGLLKFKSPVIKRLVYPNPVLTTDKQLVVWIEGFAFEAKPDVQYTCRLILKNDRGEEISFNEEPVDDNMFVSLPLENPEEGLYTVDASIYDPDGTIVTRESGELRIIKGYLK